MARRLKTIAKWINENMPGYHAVVEDGYCNTDRKIPGTRLIHPGKGRTGNRIIVRRGDPYNGEVVLDHNAAETYRYNDEVEGWLKRELERVAAGK